jgi:hypothetical protein
VVAELGLLVVVSIAMSIAAWLWRQLGRTNETDTEIHVRDHDQRGQAFAVGVFWLLICLGFLIVPAIATGKLWAIPLTIPGLAWTAWLFRVASVGIWTSGNELVIRNIYRTWRLPRGDIRAIETGKLKPHRRGQFDVPYLVTQSGQRIVLAGALRRGQYMRLDQEQTKRALAPIRQWVVSPEPARRP